MVSRPLVQVGSESHHFAVVPVLPESVIGGHLFGILTFGTWSVVGFILFPMSPQHVCETSRRYHPRVWSWVSSTCALPLFTIECWGRCWNPGALPWGNEGLNVSWTQAKIKSRKKTEVLLPQKTTGAEQLTWSNEVKLQKQNLSLGFSWIHWCSCGSRGGANAWGPLPNLGWCAICSCTWVKHT